MDRNSFRFSIFDFLDVALRKESVDRNPDVDIIKQENSVSLSARRAWIEIPKKVSVIVPSGSSLSARRAWIEIFG